MVIINDIYTFLNEIAPVRYQMDFDNAGFLVGDGGAVVKKALEKEGKAILSNVRKGAAIVAMCIEGKQLTSPGLAEKLEQAAQGGDSGAVTFLIGSSYGLTPAVKQRAQLRLSMSAMTFPHQLARVMLLEQIYRGYQILAGTKYHK